MKYLHVMNYSNYIVSQSFARFIGDFFSAEEHTFVFVGKFDNKFDRLSSKCEIVHLQTREQLIPYLKEAELILLHAMTFNAKMQIISLLNPSIMRKMVWIAWGGDLHKNNLTFNLKYFINRMVKNLFIRKLRFFVSIFDPDAKYFEDNYKSGAKILKTCYVGGCYEETYQKSFDYVDIGDKYKNGECVNIIIGHQANPELNHIRVLNQLLSYKDENIKIYIPLNYGDRSNAQAVEMYAKELYGEKVVILKEWMNLDEYNRLLENMDIAVFDTIRQIGLGNINKLIYMQKKLFMLPGSIMYDFYKTNGVSVHDCTDIGKMDFCDFIRSFKNDTGIAFIKEWLSGKEKKISGWTEVFMLVNEVK